MTSREQLELLQSTSLALAPDGNTLRLRAAVRLVRSLSDLVVTAAKRDETALKEPVWEQLHRIYYGLRAHAIRTTARRSVRRVLLAELLAFRESGIVPDPVLVEEAGAFLGSEDRDLPRPETLRLYLFYVRYGLQANSLQEDPIMEMRRPDSGEGDSLLRAELMALFARLFPEDATTLPGFRDALFRIHDTLVPEALAGLSQDTELADIESLYNLLAEEIRPEEDRRLLGGLAATLDKHILPAQPDPDAHFFLRSLILDAENRAKREGRWG